MPRSRWQLPPGVSRALWEACHNPEVARQYDAQLADTPLLQYDLEFVLRDFEHACRVIDLGCGTGRLSVALAQRGYSCVGVDLSLEMLKVLRDKAAAAQVQVSAMVANLVELDMLADASFDCAMCMFSTLGLIEGAEARARALRHVHRLLRPGGHFVLHVHNRWFHLWTAHGRRLLAGNLWRSWLGLEAAGDFDMPAQAGVGSLRMHLFTRQELRNALRAAGFFVREIRPISLAADGQLAAPWWLPGVRSYGYLVAASKLDGTMNCVIS